MNGLPFLFTTAVFTTIANLSLISHKEVRFIFPLLPLLHIITAPAISSFFYTTKVALTYAPPSGRPKYVTVFITRRKRLLSLLLILNFAIGGYPTLFHQRGVLAVTKFLRVEYENLALDETGALLTSSEAKKHEVASWYKEKVPFDDDQTFAGFLMPCHSTPWRSQFFYPGLKAWALTCEPPIGLEKGSLARERYRDEADRFYDDPKGFLEREVNTRERPWPRYIVGFEGIGEVLKEYYEETMKGFRVREKWRGVNSHWHDDPRRKGDVVVWEFVDATKMDAED
jgi:phosphatidylinositol glycan class B